MSVATSIKLSEVTEERIPGFAQRVSEILAEAVGANKSRAMRELGVAYTTVTKWANGTVTPNLKQVPPLAKLGGVRLEWLITGNGPKYVEESRNEAAESASGDRRVVFRKAVESYLAGPLAGDISAEVRALLLSFDFSTLGISTPTVRDVQRVRDLMDMQVQMGHFGPNGGADSR